MYCLSVCLGFVYCQHSVLKITLLNEMYFSHSQLNGTIMKIRCLRHISGCQLTCSNFSVSIYVVYAKTNLMISGLL